MQCKIWGRTLGVGVPAEILPLAAGDYPALYRAADSQSQRGQGRYLSATRLRLILVVCAGAAGLASVHVRDLRLLGLVGASAFTAATILELFLRTNRPERIWYDGRAAAESAKSLTWRYGVGGNPFPMSLGDGTDASFVGRLAEVIRVVPGTHLVPDDHTGEQITVGMRTLREASHSIRRDTYLTGRIVDQKSWYGKRSLANERSFRRWSTILVVTEIVGACASILQATDAIDVDLAGFVAALVAVAVAWVETRQHGTLASAYAVAHHELGMIEARISTSMTEEEWAGFVDESEEAISREHTLWRASRRG